MSKKLSRFHPISLFVTLGVGYIPFAPGTWGSLPAFPIAAAGFMNLQGDAYPVLWGVVIALYVLGAWATTHYMKRTGKHDPKEVIIDEVVGQLITLLIAAPIIGAQDHGDMRGFLMLFACFALFRFFDILKPWPVSWADKKLDNAHGVMLDDVLAGIYAGGVFWLGYWGLDYAIGI